MPVLTIQIDREKTARMGLNLADVQDVISTAIGGKVTGTFFQGDRRFDMVVPLPEALRSDIAALERLPVRLPAYLPTQLPGQLPGRSPTPNQVSRENGKRSIVVTANVRGRDIGSFVHDAQ